MIILVGDCVEQMKLLEGESVDSIVTDPPYGLGFMGKEWDSLPPGKEWAEECLRVLKPGAHLLAFGGTRTHHRLAVAIEDAGFEIRDTVCWLYGSGFPKSLNLKDEWDGWGTALKPAHEPVVVARKPLIGTVAKNVLEHGTGALNIDATRIGTGEDKDDERWYAWQRGESVLQESKGMHSPGRVAPRPDVPAGRWPANVVLDEDAAKLLDEQTGERSGRPAKATMRGEIIGSGEPGMFVGSYATTGYEDSGGASRFFYTAKASRAERNAGLDGFEERATSSMPGRRDAEDAEWDTGHDVTSRFVTQRRNVHPTVKPVALMRWLVRLVTPPGGVVLDPFMGSGTTGIACAHEGFNFIGIEKDVEYADIAKARIAHWQEVVAKEKREQSEQLRISE